MTKNYSTTTAFESTIMPGLTFTLKKRSQSRRSDFNRDNARILAAINDALWVIQPLQREGLDAEAEAKLEPCSCNNHEHSAPKVPDGMNIKAEDLEHLCSKCSCRQPKYRDGLVKELSAARDEYSRLRRDTLYPALIKWCLVGVEPGDYMIEGDPVSLANVASLPEEVLDELGNEIDRMGSLSPEEKLGFQSPGTSPAQVAGQTQTATAETAK